MFTIFGPKDLVQNSSMLEWKSLDWFQQSPCFLGLGTFVMFEVGLLLLGISIHNFLLFDVATVMNNRTATAASRNECRHNHGLDDIGFIWTFVAFVFN